MCCCSAPWPASATPRSTAPPAASPSPTRAAHAIRFAFGLVLMLGIALVDIRFLARLAWPSYAVSLGVAGAGGADGPCRQGRAALDRVRRHPAAAERDDEDRAGAGAGGLVSPRVVGADGQSAVPDPADHRGAAAGRADPEGAQSGHRGDHRAGRCARCSSRPACAGGSSCWWRCRSRSRRASPTTICTTTRRRASTPSCQSRERSAGRRLQHHPVEDRARVGRHVGQGLPAGHAGPSELPAREADRFHLHHDRRGVRPGRRHRGDGAARPDRDRRAC